MRRDIPYSSDFKAWRADFSRIARSLARPLIFFDMATGRAP
jgi:hypothetical protein